MNRDYKTFFAICKAIGREKEDVVFEFTKGESSSLKSLNEGEYKELMVQLRKLQPAPEAWTPPAGDIQRKKMIGLAKSMHWGRDNIEIIRRLDEWCLKTYKIKMNDMDIATIGKAVTVFERKVYPNYLEGLKNNV